MGDLSTEESALFQNNHWTAPYSIQEDEYENNENSPIISMPMENNNQSTQVSEKMFLIFLLLLLLVGLAVGVHLLIREGHEWRASEAYNLTTREFWKAHVPSSIMPELKLPVTGVLFLQTNSTTCDSKSQCAKLVHELQLKHMKQWKEPDIFYNFLISRDGSFFEGRGWNFQTTFAEYSSNVTITVAFLGEFNTNPPTPKLVQSARLFVDVAVMKGKLKPCYNIMVWGQNDYFREIAQSIQKGRSLCQSIP